MDEVTSVRREVEPFIHLTPSERGELVMSACRTAQMLLRARADADLVLAWRDPMPESSKTHLARLRALAMERRKG